MNSYRQKKFEYVTNKYQNRGRLLISCNDKPGIVAKVSQWLFEYKANIVESNQYSTSHTDGLFFMRIEFECPDFQKRYSELKESFHEVASSFKMDWQLQSASKRKKTAIFVSKEDHCLQELLWNYERGELYTDIAMVVSNHETMREFVESKGIPFHYIPVTKETKPEAEKAQLELLESNEIDFVILARYMQILSSDFVTRHPNRVMNIHHSFLPAFVGAKPYERAYERGVKLIGATAHYVTDELDQGPIVEQDIERVDHRDSIEELKRIGRSVEKSVLARGVKWHLEDRILVYGNKTIVFD
ncbi:formyltetrahydrofolate deformylase [Priestia endophytica]|uniref:Formyltetrahydrofolate deformylase n=1 Tax=Priestia endophytica TaxID=135735 RepID=A0AAX1Q1V6_9BACI|nr:formyltetrahydrofolate deformylase [Priestia endophytica]RAS71934.1 formyltetrahydrofolate deformylase [Priestia endophytica]RAS89552.1 formyltetrahydrofolate deformylase [Priestia endophytica]